MRLPEQPLSLPEQLAEFDVWITASLGEIRDTDKFREQMDAVVGTFDAMCTATANFKKEKDCEPTRIADSFVDLIEGKSADEAAVILESLAAVLFLVTGKSDNNAKCQLPLFLRDVAKLPNLPIVRRKNGSVVVSYAEIPRELKAERYLGLVAALGTEPDLQKQLLEQFVGFLLSDGACVAQLWSVGYSYAMLKDVGKERDLLAPLVVFQVRGSVAASGGHDPEEMLRARLKEWGLQPGTDFNESDVVLEELLRLGTGGGTIAAGGGPSPRPAPAEADPEKVQAKTRAYDFALPYRISGWQPQLLVQSQFYAGDSGSVSHKNVDQTSTARKAVHEVLPTARFVEYVDGAGYFSTLNRDLKHLLNMPNTADFFQVRSAAVRLRRDLQVVGFVTPLEIEHAIVRTSGSVKEVEKLLKTEGYDAAEIKRGIAAAVVAKTVDQPSKDRLALAPARREIVRRYLLLDTAAALGTTPAVSDRTTGYLLVPGYGPFHGLKLDQLISESIKLAPGLRDDLRDSEVVLADIRWLCEQGIAIAG
jgi:hypothetical protein